MVRPMPECDAAVWDPHNWREYRGKQLGERFDHGADVLRAAARPGDAASAHHLRRRRPGAASPQQRPRPGPARLPAQGHPAGHRPQLHLGGVDQAHLGGHGRLQAQHLPLAHHRLAQLPLPVAVVPAAVPVRGLHPQEGVHPRRRPLRGGARARPRRAGGAGVRRAGARGRGLAVGGRRRHRVRQGGAVAELLRGAPVRPAQPDQRPRLRDPLRHLQGHVRPVRLGHLPHGRGRGELQLLEQLGADRELDALPPAVPGRAGLPGAVGPLPDAGVGRGGRGERREDPARRALDERPHGQGPRRAVPQPRHVHHPDLDDRRGPPRRGAGEQGLPRHPVQLRRALLRLRVRGVGGRGQQLVLPVHRLAEGVREQPVRHRGEAGRQRDRRAPPGAGLRGDPVDGAGGRRVGGRPALAALVRHGRAAVVGPAGGVARRGAPAPAPPGAPGAARRAGRGAGAAVVPPEPRLLLPVSARTSATHLHVLPYNSTTLTI